MNFFEVIGEACVTILLLMVTILIIRDFIYKRHGRRKKDNKSSFVLNVNDQNIEDKYKDLDMRSFNDIGGLHEVKSQLKRYVKCFECTEEFKAQNVEVPRGIILWGPPGCGKTSLAKAIAYEAHVNFICRNASDLVDRSPFSDGNGDNIGKLFKEARALAPCIVFIDELDIIGGRFDAMGNAASHQVEVTRLLAEMDGFQDNSGIMVIAASNNHEMLDRALVRSGRFGKKYYVGPPMTRQDILEVVNMYTKGKKLNAEVTNDVLVTVFSGRSPADIKYVLNECGVQSILDNSEVTLDMLRKAILEIDLETNLENKTTLSDTERRKTARHEAGHAIVAAALGIPVQTVTILGTSTGVRGLTQQIYVNDTLGIRGLRDGIERLNCTSIGFALRQVAMCYGGVATELIEGTPYNELDIGCKSDVHQATKVVNDLINGFGYTFNTLVNLAGIDQSENIKAKVNDNTITELQRAQDLAIKIIKDNISVLDELATELQNKITLADETLQAILNKVQPYKVAKQ